MTPGTKDALVKINCVLVDISPVVVCNSSNPKSNWNIIQLQKA